MKLVLFQKRDSEPVPDTPHFLRFLTHQSQVIRQGET